jgi:hypothetical protein
MDERVSVKSRNGGELNVLSVWSLLTFFRSVTGEATEEDNIMCHLGIDIRK